MLMVHPVPISTGKRSRMSFGRGKDVYEMPNLIEIQLDSYNWFLNEGLDEGFDDINPISNYGGNLVLKFIGFHLDRENIKYSIEECKERDATYSAPMKVKIRLENIETGEIKEQEVFMGEFPVMTEQGTFVINGAERVIVSQLVRSPGVYYAETIDKTGKPLYSATLIPNRGAWLEYETDSNDIMYVRVDRTRKINVTVLLRALGYGTDIQLKELLGEDERLLATIDSDNANSVEEGLLEIYKRLRPGEPPTVESANQLLRSLLFDSKRYDLARVDRYKFNKKLALSARISGRVAAATVVDPNSGEILAEAGERISREKADEIQNAGINEFLVQLDNDRVAKVVGNYFVDAGKYLSFDPYEVGINEKVHYPTLKVFLDQGLEEDALKATLKESLDELIPKHVLIDDIIASVSYNLHLANGIGHIDDIDHLGNRRLRSV